MVIGVLLAGTGNCMMGFSELSGIWIGIGLLGMALSVFFVPFIPYLLQHFAENASQLKRTEALSPEQLANGH